MQNIWFPAPVFLFFRRIVNVVSTLSISQQYLLQQKSLEAGQNDTRQPNSWGLRTLDWKSWVNSPKFSLASPEEEQYFEHPSNHPPSNAPTPRKRFSHVPKPRPADQIHTLIENPVLLDPVRKPRHPIVLCHGLYGFDVRGPSIFRTHYWANVLSVLRQKVGADVIVTGVPGTGSIVSRSESLDRLLQNRAAGRAINFMAHSMGGLDCRYLISHIKPTDYTPVSLTTIGTPHRGSPFMDWCNDNLGLGKLAREEGKLAAARALSSQMQGSAPHTPKDSSNSKAASTLSLASLPSSFTTLLLSLFDSPAYANLSTSYLNSVFNPSTPDDPKVKYFSIAGRISSMNVWHPLWLPKMVLDGFEEKEKEKGRILSPSLSEHERWGNDGLVTVQSARWGEFLGIMEQCDHWSLRGAQGVEIGVDLPSVSVPGLMSSSKGEDAAGDGWAFGDWGRFVRAWKREEKVAKGAGRAVSEHQTATEETKQAMREEASRAESGKDFADDVVNASTKKLSAVFDWIVEQVPSPRNSASAPSLPATSFGGAPTAARPASTEKKAAKSDLASKQDLERFYIALCRKLYDEGL
ncbi:alpha/beta-hydrolase, partial [Cristinia sonorae]